MSAAARHRRGLSQRPFLLFGLLLLLPAFAFGLLGWRSVLRERVLCEARGGRPGRGRARAPAGRGRAGAEGDRGYGSRSGRTSTTRVSSPPSRPSSRSWTSRPRRSSPRRTTPVCSGGSSGSSAPRACPSVRRRSGPTRRHSKHGLEDAYAEPSARCCRRRPEARYDVMGRRVDHALRTVQANEERGQLIEERQIAVSPAGGAHDAGRSRRREHHVLPQGLLRACGRRAGSRPLRGLPLLG